MWTRWTTPLRRAYLLLLIDSIQQSIQIVDDEAQTLPEMRHHHVAALQRRRRQLQALEAQSYRLPRSIPTVWWCRWTARARPALSRARAWCCARLLPRV